MSPVRNSLGQIFIGICLYICLRLFLTGDSFKYYTGLKMPTAFLNRIKYQPWHFKTSRLMGLKCFPGLQMSKTKVKNSWSKVWDQKIKTITTHDGQIMIVLALWFWSFLQISEIQCKFPPGKWLNILSWIQTLIPLSHTCRVSIMGKSTGFITQNLGVQIPAEVEGFF